MSRFKKFGEDVYAYNGEDYHSHRLAQQRANELRGRGFLVRLVRSRGMYAVYTKRKDSR